MLSIAIIVFREVLEAALLIGVIAAATRGLAGRRSAILSGVAAGSVLALAVAGFTGSIARMAEGAGQELFNAVVLAVVVVMLAWHNIWMASHGREMAVNARETVKQVVSGRSRLSAITIMVTLAVLREGSETAIFLFGLGAGNDMTFSTMLTGVMLGLLAGIAAGAGLYAGLVRVPLRWFFGVTGGLILLIASGMAAKLANLLIQGDLLPSMVSPLWDTSAWLPMNSQLGSLLHILMGYEARPSGMQFVFYAATFTLIAAGMWWSRRTTHRPSRLATI